MTEETKPSLLHESIAAPPALLPITTLSALFSWYRQNLCGRPFRDPRGYQVVFEDTDFVHLIKLKDKYGKEPRNARMTIEQIQSGRITLNPARLEIRRAQELSWAQSILESPSIIVPNWQVMGRANPGDAYIKTFANQAGIHHRVLICGHAGKKRRVVTIFARDRFTDRELTPILWP